MSEQEIGYSQNIMQEFDIKTFLKISVNQGASDIHLRYGSAPMIRKNGLILKSKYKPLNQNDIEKIKAEIIPETLRNEIDKHYDFDFSFEVEDVARFRVNLLHELGHTGFVLRAIPFAVPAIDKLYLPPVLKEFTSYNSGLVLVTGPTGSGKSTTLAAMLDYLNEKNQKHVVTLEDPVEFMYTNKKSVFTQRQLGVDIDTFPNGLKYALRQDPDVIFIGEMRDAETISSALKAAETGHLVFSTLHTMGAVQTINRIINAFEPYARDAIRLQIASTLRGTIAQKLVRTSDSKTRVPATEILVVTPAIRDYIIKDQIDDIYQLQKEGSFDGMMTMDMSLYRLVKAGLITQESALHASDTANELEQMLKGSYHGVFGVNE